MRTFFIGPVGTEGGPAIKNRTLVEWLSQRAPVRVYNTVKRTPWHRIGAVLALLLAREGQIIIAVSEKGRRVLYPVLARKQRRRGLRSSCICIGGEVARRVPQEGAGVYRALAGADLVTVETQALLEAMRAIGLSNLYLLPNYRRVPPGFVPREKAFAAKGLRFVFLSSLRDGKGVATLLEAFRQLRQDDPAVTLDLYGPIRQDFDRSLLEGLAPESGVRYLGPVPNGDVLTVLDGYDVFILPTERTEGFPAVVVEAQMAGLPILASDMGHLDQLVHDGENGFVFRAGDARALYRCMRRCLQEREALSRISRTNLAASKAYRAEAVLEAYRDALCALGWTL